MNRLNTTAAALVGAAAMMLSACSSSGGGQKSEDVGRWEHTPADGTSNARSGNAQGGGGSQAAQTGQAPAAKNSAGYEEKPIVQQVTAADLDTAKSTEPVKADKVVLWVNGMGCPLCATSIDKQLERLPGVTNVKVDLANGFVDVAMQGAKRPSPHDFAESVLDAGFTLVKVEQK